MIEDNEAIYDEKIAPLMTEIIRVAREHKIPMLASFQLTPGTDENSPLWCTTSLICPGTDEKLIRARYVITDNDRALPSLLPE